MKLDGYRILLESSKFHDDKYKYNHLLFNEFLNISLDSAVFYAVNEIRIADESEGTEIQKIESRLNLAEAYLKVGMYKEASDLVQIEEVPDTLMWYYYHVRKTLCDRMADYTISSTDRSQYQKQAAYFREKRLKCSRSREYAYQSVLAEKMIDEGQLEEARYVILSDYHNAQQNNKLSAFYNYTLARIGRLSGNLDDCARFLALSAIDDIKEVCLDYIALRELAVLLYQKGEIDRAYRYLTVSLNDAKSYNSRQRMVEVNEVFSIVNDAYNLKRSQQEKKLKILLTIILILLVFLGVTSIYLLVQMKKLSSARQQLHLANENLESLNASLVSANQELNKANGKLKKINSQLSDTNIIKDEYIARYMDQCSSYIEKFEEYRKHLKRLIKINNHKELVDAINNSQDSEEELKAFYDSFDETFLNLFPSFIDDFNNLIQEDKREYPSKAASLTAEMRIFALIRLGINDSVKIAQFLRYSVTTIYNYRSRTRIKAIADRGDFEKLVMGIGKQTTTNSLQLSE